MRLIYLIDTRGLGGCEAFRPPGVGFVRFLETAINIAHSDIQSSCYPRSSVAQLVEHAAVNRRVVGSSPTWGARCFGVGTGALRLTGFLSSDAFWALYMCKNSRDLRAQRIGGVLCFEEGVKRGPVFSLE